MCECDLPLALMAFLEQWSWRIYGALQGGPRGLASAVSVSQCTTCHSVMRQGPLYLLQTFIPALQPSLLPS